MLFEVLLHFSSKACISSLYEIAHVSHSNDDLGIIQSTVLENITTTGLRIIAGSVYCHGQEGGKR